MLWSLLPSGAAIVHKRVLEEQAFGYFSGTMSTLLQKAYPKVGKR